jgi:hypothetical protein
MTFFTALFLIFIGILAAPQYVASRSPDAQGVVDSIAPYAGWIGLVGVLFGLWIMIDFLAFQYWLLRYVFVYWLTGFLSGLVLVGLGFLLSYPVLSQRLSRQSVEAAKRVDEVRAKIAPFQSLMAIASIILGAWTLFLLIAARLS